MSDTFGKNFRLSSFGESHGAAIGGVIQGCPAGMDFDFDFLSKEMQRRKPGNNKAGHSKRAETDEVEILSGVFEGKTLGIFIGFIVRNKDAKSSDYEEFRQAYRPAHADKVWEEKFGIRDHRGGGRSSARETASRVVAGAVAKMILAPYNIQIDAYTTAAGNLKVEGCPVHFSKEIAESNLFGCPDIKAAKAIEEIVAKASFDKDTLGGVITCVAKGLPAGLGEPVFAKLHSLLAAAVMSIPAARGFQLGNGFELSKLPGSRVIDDVNKNSYNLLAGVKGGISDGGPLWFETAFRAASSIAGKIYLQNKEGEKLSTDKKGRHDVFFLPRAIPIVEAMTAMVIVDLMMEQRVISKR